MMELVKSLAPRPVIVCPATEDGIACSIILNRFQREVLNTYYFPESSPLGIFKYPAIRAEASNKRLIFAGFPFPPNLEDMDSSIPRGDHLWFSHHYGLERSIRFLQSKGWIVVADPSLETTSSLLIRHYEIDNTLSRECARMLAQFESPVDDAMNAWRNISLASMSDTAGIRRNFQPLFNRATTQFPDPDPMAKAAGEKIHDLLQDLVGQGRHHVFTTRLDGSKCAILGVPPSMTIYYRALASMAFQILDCRFCLFLLDQTGQIVLYRSLAQKAAESTEQLAEKIDGLLGRNLVRLYDRNTLVISEPGLPLVKTVESIMSGL